jgi:hypothetical protein
MDDLCTMVLGLTFKRDCIVQNAPSDMARSRGIVTGAFESMFNTCSDLSSNIYHVCLSTEHEKDDCNLSSRVTFPAA